MIGNDWDQKLSIVWNSDGFKLFIENIYKLYSNKSIYPPKDLIFDAFKNTKYIDTKVVIIGQDPYHGDKEANGLSFSVAKNIKIPPSLKNIYKELNADLGVKIPDHGDLSSWSKEGVLLLNSVLTVEKNKPASHRNIGWELFTDYVIKVLNNKETPVVFILWGNYARSKKRFITSNKHLIIESPHPSPFSAYNGFFGSKPFSRTNEFLKKNNLSEINWEIKF